MEENREFCLDAHRIVKPLADHFIGVRLDYYQQRGAWKGEFWKRMGNGFDTADQAVFAPGREVLQHHRCWKNNKGFQAAELLEIAKAHPGDAKEKDALRLSWFLVDPAAYREDVTDDGAYRRYGSNASALEEARKVRRPLVRVDGRALEVLEENQAFLKAHVRQFWWQKGDPNGPSRLVVLHFDEFQDGEGDAVTGRFPKGKTPVVLAVVGIQEGLEAPIPALDEAWRRVMEKRPSNADNLTFGKDQIPKFKAVDAHIRKLAASGELLAPGGRRLTKP
jgi:hypothetical protein